MSCTGWAQVIYWTLIYLDDICITGFTAPRKDAFGAKAVSTNRMVVMQPRTLHAYMGRFR